MTRRNVMRLAGETGADPRTVERWAEGKPTNSVTRYAFEAACTKLGVAIPSSAETIDASPLAAAGEG